MNTDTKEFEPVDDEGKGYVSAEDYRKAQAEAAAAWEAFDRYGHHDYECPRYSSSSGKCDCGFAEAIEQVSQGTAAKALLEELGILREQSQFWRVAYEAEVENNTALRAVRDAADEVQDNLPGLQLGRLRAALDACKEEK